MPVSRTFPSRAAEKLVEMSGAHELSTAISNLNTNFDRAQENLNTIGRLCQNAEDRIRKSQGTQNRIARDFHAITERARHLLANVPESGGQTAEEVAGDQ